MTEAILEDRGQVALREGAALVVRPTAGLLMVTDADRADFLHRMTTNEINRLQPGSATVTVLTSPTARIVQVFTLLCRADALWLLPSPGEATNLARHLQGQIFFMDKVKMQDASDAYQRLRLVGPQAVQALATIGLAVDDLVDAQWVEKLFAEESILLLNQQRYDLPGFELIVPNSALAALQMALAAAGVVTVDDNAYHERRIELGRPAPGYELTDAYNPLEAGIGWSCADDKGCYTGQEIIARQITYDKITKTLVGLRSDGSLAVGQALTASGRNVGTVTSTVVSKMYGPIALAIVKRSHNEVGTALQADDMAVHVVGLPFE